MSVVLTNSSTFTGNSWALDTAVGGIKLTSSQIASNSASITFTGLTARKYMLAYELMVPATDGALLQLQTSADNGSTWATTGYISGMNYFPYNSTTGTNVNSTTYFILSSAADSGSTNIGVAGEAFLLGMNSANYPSINVRSSYIDNGSTTFVNAIGVGYGGSVTANALKVFFSTGNITSGRVSLYELS